MLHFPKNICSPVHLPEPSINQSWSRRRWWRPGYRVTRRAPLRHNYQTAPTCTRVYWWHWNRFLPVANRFACPQPLLLIGQHCWSDGAIRYVSAHQLFMQNTPQLSSCTSCTQLLCPDLSEYICWQVFGGKPKGFIFMYYHPQCSCWVVHFASESIETTT